jgi:hypothetical protein
MKKPSEEDSKGGGDNKISNYSFDDSKYQIFVKEVKSKNLNSIECLGTSIKNSITPQDSLISNPKNIVYMPTKYPTIPMQLKQDLFEKFNDDTLFLMFFIQQVFI